MSTAEMIPAAQQTAIATQQPATLKGWLQSDQLKAEIAKALPRHCSAERMTRIAITALTRTPKLADCEHASFIKCLLDLSQWGLEPNGRDAHLIPFKNNKLGIVECQLILDYKGVVQLLYRSGQVLSVHADVVHEGDEFSYSTGIVQRHTPWFLRTGANKPADQGNVIAAYCRVELKGAAIKCEVMSKQEIDGIRGRSKASSSGPWVSDYNEMAKKTVFRRASKWLPISAEMTDALNRDFDTPDFDGPGVVLPPANTLGDLTKRLENRHAAVEPEPTADHPTLDTLEEIHQAIETAGAETVRNLYDRHVGPDSKLSQEERSQVTAWCEARSAELDAAAEKKPASGDKLFETSPQA